MSIKNIYNSNVNSTIDLYPKQDNNLRNKNQKYVATIVEENLRRNSVDYGDKRKLSNFYNEEKAAKIKNDKSKEKKVSKKSEELLKMSVNYNDYDFNEWDRRISDSYNPYAIDEFSSASISNYEKIKRIMAQESRYEKNFDKFRNNLDNIYDDIKEKITNETLKIIHGEDNFEYIPNNIETYQENWITGDEQADLLLKIYHSPKMKQRDISASEYISQKYSEFAKSIDGKQSFEVFAAKTGVNPSDVVRVNLDRAYYMDEQSAARNKADQELYAKAIAEKNGGNKNSNMNSRFGANKSSARQSARPTPPPPPTGKQPFSPMQDDVSNENAFVLNSDENQVQVASDSRVMPRRDEWLSPKHNEQLSEKTDSEWKWYKLKEIHNPKLEELIIENGLDISDIYNDVNTNKCVVVLSSIIFDDEIREQHKLKLVQRFANRNKYELEINNNENNKTQVIKFMFSLAQLDMMNDDVVDQNDNNNDTLDVKDDVKTNLNNFNGFVSNKTTSKKDNISIAGISKLDVSKNTKTKNLDAHSNKNSGIEVLNEDKIKSLADVLAEKRNKNHQQMNKSMLNKKVSLQKAIDDISKERKIDFGPRKNKSNDN